VNEIRSDGVVVISPDSWLLAHGKAPVFYLNAKDVSLLHSAQNQGGESETNVTSTENVASFSSRLMRAIEMKDQGTEAFEKNDLDTASTLYRQALTVLNVREILILARYAQECMSNIASIQSCVAVSWWRAFE
jgi:hypothetical protein